MGARKSVIANHGKSDEKHYWGNQSDVEMFGSGTQGARFEVSGS